MTERERGSERERGKGRGGRIQTMATGEKSAGGQLRDAEEGK